MIRIDTWYDVACDNCAKSRSTDYERGMETDKRRLRRYAHEEGWKYKEGQTLCPECAKGTH